MKSYKKWVGYITEHTSVSSVSHVTPSRSEQGAYTTKHAVLQGLEPPPDHCAKYMPKSLP